MVVSLHTFMFADLCGFTEYSALHGDDRAAELATGFHARVRTLAAEHACEIVKVIGDAVMVRTLHSAHAVELALRLRSLPGFPPVRMGIDTGPARPMFGDWWGTTVNTAARVTATAGPGELLMTGRTRMAACAERELRTSDRGLHPLKGLPKCRLYSVPASAS